MRLIDAEKVGRGMAETWQRVIVGLEVDKVPTIDPESLPIVRQLREELALTTQQCDIYKYVFERITAHGDCNNCANVRDCRFAPMCGEDTRYNCPLWCGTQEGDCAKGVDLDESTQKASGERLP